jgi:hypothetical protein
MEDDKVVEETLVFFMTWQLSVHTFCTPKQTRKDFAENFVQKKWPKDC